MPGKHLALGFHQIELQAHSLSAPHGLWLR